MRRCVMSRHIDPKNVKSIILQLLIIVAILAAVSLLAIGIRDNGFPAGNIVVVYVLSILLVARFTHAKIIRGRHSLTESLNILRRT